MNISGRSHTKAHMRRTGCIEGPILIYPMAGLEGCNWRRVTIRLIKPGKDILGPEKDFPRKPLTMSFARNHWAESPKGGSDLPKLWTGRCSPLHAESYHVPSLGPCICWIHARLSHDLV